MCKNFLVYINNLANLSIAIATKLRIEAVDAITSNAIHASHKTCDNPHSLFTFKNNFFYINFGRLQNF
jgi:hypothetical protein